jgi:predicted DNA-binding protein YlxM (UPF0122 family)
MYITLVEKSSEGLRLSIYDESLVSLETESFKDSYTLNFHLQALAKKHGIEKSILVIHDKDRNTVNLLLAHEENLFFVS